MGTFQFKEYQTPVDRRSVGNVIYYGGHEQWRVTDRGPRTPHPAPAGYGTPVERKNAAYLCHMHII